MSSTSIAQRIALMTADDLGGFYPYAIALHLALRWADEDGNTMVRQVDVAAWLCISERTVRDAYSELRDRGILVPVAAIACRFDLSKLVASPAPRAGQPAGGAGLTLDTTGTTCRSTGRRRRCQDSSPAPRAGQPAPAAGPVSRDSESLSPAPAALMSKEEGEARASDRHLLPAAPPAGHESGNAWEPTGKDAAYLGWVNKAGLPWAMANGTDLRREWCAVLRHMRSPEADAVRARMRGDLPSDFARAIGDDLAAVLKQRVADAAKDDGAALAEERAAAARLRAAKEAQDERIRTETAQQLKDAAETGTLLEQGRTLIVAVDADPKRAQGMLNRTASMMASLRTAVAAGRVPGHLLGPARISWNETRALPEPAPSVGEPTPPPPPNPDHPAAPDRDHPLVLLDDDAPPVDEDPVVTALYSFLSQRGLIVVPDVADAWLSHLVEAGAAMTSTDALAYLGLAFQVASQRGILVAYPSDIPSQALVAWAALADAEVPA